MTLILVYSEDFDGSPKVELVQHGHGIGLLAEIYTYCIYFEVEVFFAE